MRDLNIWCYECDTYIAPQSLASTRLALVRAKASLPAE